MLLSNICTLQAFPDKDSSPAFLFRSHFLKKQSGFQTLWKRVFELARCSLCDCRDQAVAPQTWRHEKQSLCSPLSPVPTYGCTSSPGFIPHIHPCGCVQRRWHKPSQGSSCVHPLVPGRNQERGNEWQGKSRGGGCFVVPMLEA